MLATLVTLCLLPGPMTTRPSLRPASALATTAPSPDARRLLLVSGSAYRSKDAKEEVLAALRDLPAEARDALLDEALALVDSAASPAGFPASLFSRRWPVRLPSRRAALGGFGRLMARMEEVRYL